MNHKNEMVTALLSCMVIAAFVIGMRCGMHDRNVTEAETWAQTEQLYMNQIENLSTALEYERQIEHTVVDYTYTPLPVDYETIGAAEISETDAVILAKTMWGEYRDTANYAQCAAVAWCIMNRVDAGYGTIEEVATGGQYHGWNSNNPVDAGLYRIACGVLARRALEDYDLCADVGRVLPKDFLWMEGNGRVNTYRNSYKGGEHITP